MDEATKQFVDANTKAMAKTTLTFFKEAFCVDGEVKFVEGEFRLIGKFVIELNDSKRGQFYISKVKRA
jgi:hypothetical protein